ncbi:MAG: hypothetical protein HEEMFOPI_00469 [Holosporales bacterium]
MEQLNRRFFLKTSGKILSLLPFIPFLTSCKKSNEEPFKIGFLTPKTGNDAQGGLSCERGAKIAEEFLNQIGLKAHISIVDTESNIETARIKAQKLIQNGAHCLVGAFNSAVSSAIAQIANANSIPFIIDLSVADQLTEQGHTFVFRNFPTATMIGEQNILCINDLLKQQPDYKTATLLILNDPYGQTILKAFRENEQDLPFKIDDVIQFDYKAKDLSAEILKVKSINSDILLVVSRSHSTNIIVKELIAQNHHPKLILGPANQGFFEKQFFNIFKKNSNNIYTVHAWMDKSARLFKVASDIFKKHYPDEIFELNAAFSLEAIYIAALAFHISKSNNGHDLKAALKNMNEKEKIMIGGNISFNEKGQRETLNCVTLMNKDEETYIVSPKELKEIDPILPFPGFNA